MIEREKVNKMTLQNVSIVLSPTMQISHRLLYCFFEFSGSLFGSVVLRKYVPPISGPSGLLPESPEGIEEEMKKQESLLEALHREISLGVASKATEEQLWEQQRIVTQLKRNLRHALAKVSTTTEPKRPDFEEELNFSLQTPQAYPEPSQPKGEDEIGGCETNCDALCRPDITDGSGEQNKAEALEGLSSPEIESSAGNGSQEHRVTVQIHQAPAGHHAADTGTSGHVTVIHLSRQSPPQSERLQEESQVTSEDQTRQAAGDNADSTANIIA